MRRRGIPDSHVSHPNVTPLIDIVMCLIIFYMLVAKIGVKTGADAEIELPVSLQGLAIQDLGNTLTLNVSAAGEQPLVTLLNPQTGALEEVKIVEGGRRPLDDLLKTLRAKNPELKIILRGDQDLDYRFVEPVLISCANAKVKNINYATRKPETVAN